jgi:hypothetical protein
MKDNSKKMTVYIYNLIYQIVLATLPLSRKCLGKTRDLVEPWAVPMEGNSSPVVTTPTSSS